MKNEITKERLEELYAQKGKTLAECALYLRTSVLTVRAKMEEFGIRIRGRGQARGRAVAPVPVKGPPVKSLKDMSPEEQKKILTQYGARGAEQL